MGKRAARGVSVEDLVQVHEHTRDRVLRETTVCSHKVARRADVVWGAPRAVTGVASGGLLSQRALTHARSVDVFAVALRNVEQSVLMRET